MTNALMWKHARKVIVFYIKMEQIHVLQRNNGPKLNYQLTECCDEELQLPMYRSPGDNIASETEQKFSELSKDLL